MVGNAAISRSDSQDKHFEGGTSDSGRTEAIAFFVIRVA
jgi:hypothetical protein